MSEIANSKLLEANIPNDLYSEIEERVRLGFFPTKSDVVNSALRKAFAEEGRDFLRKFIKSFGITKRSLLNELKKIRN